MMGTTEPHVTTSTLPKAPTNGQGGRERSANELFQDLAREMSSLVRQEVKLASIEMSEKASLAAKRAGVAGIGAGFAAAALLTLVAALVLGLGTMMPLWLSALIVGVGVGVIGLLLVLLAVRALKHTDPKPQQTLLSLEETKTWAHNLVR